MKVINKVLLVLYVLAITAAAVALACLAWNPTSMDALTGFLQSLTVSMAKWWTTIAGVVLVVLSLELLSYGFRNTEPDSVLIKQSTEGDIRVTIASLDQIAIRAARAVEGVREVKVKAQATDNTLRYRVTIGTATSFPVLAATEAVQAAVKNDIEQIAGISVISVKVYVDNSTTGKSR